MKELSIKYWRKDYSFNNWCWSSCITTCKYTKNILFCTILNSKWINDLQLRPSTLYLMEENVAICLNSVQLEIAFYKILIVFKTLHKWKLIKTNKQKTYTQQKTP